jgi:TonB-linked SusC/RagA family outer membrane protein
VHRNLILASADGTVASVLQDALAGTDISYQVMDRLIVLTTINSQQIKVTGTVSDGSTNEPLPGVNILVEGTGQGVITDANGAYSIIVPSASSVLIFSYVGYNSEKVDVAGRGNIDILLAPDVQSLEEVVVIGYGTRLKKDVTTSISTVNSKDIAKTVNSTAEYSMMGRMAGVQVSGATGDPLTRPTVRIRGVNTWGVADPLYVIDGIAVTETGAGADALADGRFGTLRGNINIMTLIDPNDIESISVLKDASAAAIYGVRAANGVILITTKQGKKGDKPFLEFNARYGTQKIPKFYDVMSTPDLIKFKEDAYIANSSIGSDQTKWSELNPASPNYIGENPADINWQKAIINSYAPTQEYNLRLSGGTERSAYSISGGYANSEGVLLGKNLERYSVATNLRSEINNWLRVGLNYRLAYVKGKDNTIEGFNLMNMSQMPTWQPIYDPNGYLGYASSVSVNPDGITGTPGKWSSDPKSNARGQLATVDDTYGELRNMGTSYIEIEPIQGLKLKGTISVDYFNRSTENFTDYDGWQFNYGAEQSKVKVYPNSVGSLSNNIASNVNIIKEFSVNYVKSLGDHHFDLLFNAMDQQYRFRSSLATGYAMTTKDKGPRFIGNMEDGNTNVQTDVARNALQGYLGRFSYSFRSRYYLDVTVRRDGS